MGYATDPTGTPQPVEVSPDAPMSDDDPPRLFLSQDREVGEDERDSFDLIMLSKAQARELINLLNQWLDGH
jgi:hypothetical protein